LSSPLPGGNEIRDYLLRRMPESARARFEEAYFRNDGLLDRIETEEDSLVSDYVLGRLPDTERRLFEDSLLDTPYYRERVETTRSIRLRLAEERFFKKKAAVAGGATAPSEGHDARLFPKGTGIAVGAGLLVLVSAASLASAFFLKAALSRSRRELAERTAAPAPAATAGVVPLAQTVVLAPPPGTGPALVRLRRPAGGATGPAAGKSPAPYPRWPGPRRGPCRTGGCGGARAPS